MQHITACNLPLAACHSAYNFTYNSAMDFARRSTPFGGILYDPFSGAQYFCLLLFFSILRYFCIFHTRVAVAQCSPSSGTTMHKVHGFALKYVFTFIKNIIKNFNGFVTTLEYGAHLCESLKTAVFENLKTMGIFMHILTIHSKVFTKKIT